MAAGEKAPIRFAVPRPGETVFADAIRGELRFDHANVDDFVLLRSDGTPTYHLASSVDDVDHAITHIIRGEDLLPSTPKHILIAKAMGAPEPVYAHLSLLTGPDGAKLSKRHGATSLRAYRDEGILAEAMRNYLAILGWSPGTDEEIVSLETMVARFDLGAVSRNPAVFDVTKLEWMNGVYIRALGPAEFAGRALPFVEQALGRPLEAAEQAAFAAIAPLVQEQGAAPHRGGGPGALPVRRGRDGPGRLGVGDDLSRGGPGPRGGGGCPRGAGLPGTRRPSRARCGRYSKHGDCRLARACSPSGWR